MAVQHKQHSGDLIITRIKAFTPDDDAPITKQTIGFVVKGISINADGDVAFKTINPGTEEPDATVTVSLKAGIIYPIRPFLILDTGTTPTTVHLYG